MASPFCSTEPWSAADRHPPCRGPRRRFRPRAPRRPGPKTPVEPWVFNVPVDFAGFDGTPAASMAPLSEEARSATATAAAVAIQRVFRGQLVRKNVRKVSVVAAEVDEIEQKVLHEEERLWAQSKERLRVGEMLMSLLFRLDSVRGVRDYRKKVIRRVIDLQEYVDWISDSAGWKARTDPNAAVGEAAAETIQEKQYEGEMVSGDAETSAQERGDPESTAVEGAASSSQEREYPNLAAVKDAEEHQTLGCTYGLKEEAEDEDFVVVPVKEAIGMSPMEAESEANHDFKEHEAEPMTMGEAETGVSGSRMAEEDPIREESTDEALKKMMAGSERLQGLVTELCQQNAAQCWLIAGLVKRVEHLERVVQNMEKEKEKKRHANSALAPPVDKKSSSTKQQSCSQANELSTA